MLIEMVGSDERIDERNHGEQINKLHVRCPVCDFPDLDHAPEPYYINRARSKGNQEIALAGVGNFLVRQRVRLILEVISPGSCRFAPTYFQKTNEKTDWTLAVPINAIGTGAKVIDKVPRCPVCREPRWAHPGSQYEYPEPPLPWRQAPGDTYKDSLWGTTCDGTQLLRVGQAYRLVTIDPSKRIGASTEETLQGLHRNLYFSVRFWQLLKKAGARGLYEYNADSSQETKPDPQDVTWIETQMVALRSEGLDKPDAGTAPAGKTSRFRRFLKEQAGRGEPKAAITELERRSSIALPSSYKEFITQVGTQTFENVDGTDGLSVSILPAGEVDFDHYRIDCNVTKDDEESRAVDGILIACTPYGDAFCFDIAQPGPEYPVVWYRHEGDFFEPYTSDFMEFVDRLSSSVA